MRRLLSPKAWLLIVVAALAILFASPCLAQLGPEDEVGKSEFQEALSLLHAGAPSPEGMQRLRRLADQARGHYWGARARLELANRTPALEAVPIYETLSSDYPDTHFDAVAQISLIGIRHTSEEDEVDVEAVIEELGTLARRFGSPSLEEILSETNKTENVALVKALPIEKQSALGCIYVALWARLALPEGGLGQTEQGLSLEQFTRDSLGVRASSQQSRQP